MRTITILVSLGVLSCAAAGGKKNKNTEGADGNDQASDATDASDGAGDASVDSGLDGTDAGTADATDSVDATDGADAVDGAQTGGAIGDACAAGSECAGSTCIPIEAGYCSQSGCETTPCPGDAVCASLEGAGKQYCLKACTEHAECGTGQICRENGTCWFGVPGTGGDTPTGSSPIGGSCEEAEDCKDAGATCYPFVFDGEPTGYVNGYCIKFDCSTASPCASGAVCTKVNSDGTMACLAACQTTSDCRSDEGYACFESGICYPGCGDGSSCPEGTACGEDGTCTPACTAESCGPGQVCKADGLCDDPPCTATSCGAGLACGGSGDCVPDLDGAPTGGPGPECPNLPPRDCTGGEAVCGELHQFEPVDGPGYTNYPLNGETEDNQYRSFAREDLQMLIKWAAAYVDCKAAAWEGGNGHVLGLGDMSEENGAIPGTSKNNPGHPPGTHVNGFDMDIAYFQNQGPNNYLRPICEHTIAGTDEQHCTKPPHLLDLWRTSLFLGALLSSPRVRVIGVDGQVGPFVTDAIAVLCADGWLPKAGCQKTEYLAYETEGNVSGWYYFHHHHLHVSINSLAGKPGMGTGEGQNRCLVEGCPPISLPQEHSCLYGDGGNNKPMPVIHRTWAPD